MLICILPSSTSFFSTFSVPTKDLALSEIIVEGHPLCAAKCWGECINDGVERASTILGWIVQTVAQEKTELPRPSLFYLIFKFKGPKGWTLVTVKEGENGFNLSAGKSAMSMVCGGWQSFLQMMLLAKLCL